MGFYSRLFGFGRKDQDEPVELSPAETALRNELDVFKNDPLVYDSPLRYAIRWTGSVQGVGFRWTHQRYAQSRGLTGWVQNLDDGSVIMEIQGPAQYLLAHLEKIHADYQRMHNPIWLDSFESMPANKDESDFDVKLSPGGY